MAGEDAIAEGGGIGTLVGKVVEKVPGGLEGPAMEAASEFTTVSATFLRARNVLLLEADFTPLFIDYYLHLKDLDEHPAASLGGILKDLLAVTTLHLTAGPWAETHAWTANLRAPRANFFATGSSNTQTVTGRLFTENVREPDRNFLHTQTTVFEGEPRRSTIEVEDTDPLKWAEHYYQQSEQRPARAFRLTGDRYALLTAQPDFAEEWLASLTAGSVENLLETEPHRELETRRYRFHCGCNLQKILPVLSAWREKPEELFQGDPSITIQCPRCAKRYEVKRGDLES